MFYTDCYCVCIFMLCIGVCSFVFFTLNLRSSQYLLVSISQIMKIRLGLSIVFSRAFVLEFLSMKLSDA